MREREEKEKRRLIFVALGMDRIVSSRYENIRATNMKLMKRKSSPQVPNYFFLSIIPISIRNNRNGYAKKAARLPCGEIQLKYLSHIN